MNRIDQLFGRKKENILSVYFTAGHPRRDDTAAVIRALQSAGADMVEIGMPFSDPLADGPVLQRSAGTALRNGMTLKRLFAQLERIRQEAEIPLLLMGYLNPLLQFGMEAFCRQCAETGIDGMIIPDLPVDEYVARYKKTMDAAGLKNVCLVTPQTTAERVRYIDAQTGGFLYLVAASSTTGARETISREQEEYFMRIRSMKLRNPSLIGFGISNRETFANACRHAAGAIIGSAFVNMLDKSTDIAGDIARFVTALRTNRSATPNY